MGSEKGCNQGETMHAFWKALGGKGKYRSLQCGVPADPGGRQKEGSWWRAGQSLPPSGWVVASQTVQALGVTPSPWRVSLNELGFCLGSCGWGKEEGDLFMLGG